MKIPNPSTYEQDNSGGRVAGFASVQAGRGIAAILVVLFHCTMAMPLDKYWGEPVYGNFFAFGDSGVEFFFVLSGFIIYWAHHADFGRPERLGRYIYRRITRIYPPYWIAALLVLFAMVVIPAAGSGGVPSASDLAMAFSLVGNPHSPVLAVAWSLFHEMLFYAFFAFLIMHERAGKLAIVAWIVACLFSESENYAFSPINLLFTMGMLAAWLIKKDMVRHTGILLASGLLIFATTAKIVAPDGTKSLGYGLGAALILLGAVQAEISNRISVPKVFILIGDASYSIYLVHLTLVSFLCKTLSSLPWSFAFPAIATLSVAGGVLFHFIIEKPLLKLLQRRSVPRPSGARASTFLPERA
ncbi:MAG TPA: acyltransferase [Allosphingosinicella sp.]|jgi:peptidoglycan/LPS O-acetylase OafA/YrhL